MKNLKLYYCDCDNFGDALNKYIFEYCFGVKTAYADSWEAEAIGIGSILDRTLLQIRDIFPFILDKTFNLKKPLYILSSGFGINLEYYTKKIRFLKSTILKRKIEVVSLRGELTKAKIERLWGGGGLKPRCLGDLGLLASMLAENTPFEPIYDIGICPHYADKNLPIIEKIKQENPNSIILDASENPIEYIKKMKKCKTILSTGLHPLIAADSLGIPNLWGRVSESTTIFKYRDYYSVFNIEPEPYYLYDNPVSKDIILNKYRLKNETVEKVKEKLYTEHKKFFEEYFINN